MNPNAQLHTQWFGPEEGKISDTDVNEELSAFRNRDIVNAERQHQKIGGTQHRFQRIQRRHFLPARRALRRSDVQQEQPSCEVVEILLGSGLVQD